MTPFQVVALIVVGCLFVLTLLALLKGWTGRREGVAWLALWLMAGLAIAWPDSTTAVATTVGIRRGADLVLYCSVLGMLVGFFMVYSRLRRLRRDVTLLTRHLAIQQAFDASATIKARADGDLGK